MKHYQGTRTNDGMIVVTVLEDGKAPRPLLPRHGLRSIGDGYDWGCMNNGTRQLALAVCADALGDDARALRVFEPFATVVFFEMPAEADQWNLDAATVTDIISDIEAGEPTNEMVKNMHAVRVPYEPTILNSDVKAARDSVRAIVRAQGFSDREQTLGSFAAHFKAAQAAVEHGSRVGDPTLIALGLDEMKNTFARTLSALGDEYKVAPERTIECARVIETATQEQARKLAAAHFLKGRRPNSDDAPERLN